MGNATQRLLTLNRTHWIYIALIAVVLVPLTIGNLLPDQIYNLYFRTYTRPQVQAEFGFEMAQQRMHFRSQPFDVFVITSIDPNGVLAGYGVQANTISLGTSYPKNDIAFCKDLLRSHNQAVEIHLIDSNEYEQLLKKGEFSMAGRGYKVIIPWHNQN